MKLIALWVFFHLLLATTYAWSPISLLQSNLKPVESSSPIPLFILDIDHPWLESNTAWLSQQPNVQDGLCIRNSSLWTRPVTPSRALPADLFANLVIENNRAGQNRLGWENFADRLREIHGCAAALDGARYLHIDTFLYDGPHSRCQEPTKPPHDLPALAADVLGKMVKLERLDWGISGAAARAFEAAFVEQNVTLPSVQYLQPGAWSDYLVSRCPNLEILQGGAYAHHWSWNSFVPGLDDHGDPRLELIKAATGLSLRELKLSSSRHGWSLGMLDAILNAVPNITSLGMDGPLMPLYYGTERDSAILKRYLSVLRRFPNLIHLELPPAHDLQLGFDGGAWCGNAYDGPAGREYGRQVVRQAAEAVEFAVNVTLTELPQLKELIVGGDRANLTLNVHGMLDMTWPWTGRMDQYTHEIWPK